MCKCGHDLLVDGLWRASWTFTDHEVRVEPFNRLNTADRSAVDTEAAALTDFLAP